jgi:hypothetical protein
MIASRESEMDFTQEKLPQQQFDEYELLNILHVSHSGAPSPYFTAKYPKYSLT